MNIFDVVIVLLILLSGVTGLKRGVLKEVVMFIGTILIYLISFSLKGKVGILLCQLCPFFKLDGLVTLNILIYQMIAFFLIASILFGIFAFVMKFTKILQKLVDLSVILDLPSKILGFLFGLLEGYVVMFIVLMIIAVPLRNTEIFESSHLSNKILYESPILKDTLGDFGDAIMDVITLSTRIEYKESDDLNSINIDIMKSYFNYQIISKMDAMTLVDSHKLDSVLGIKDFVYSYQS